jgi:hypothetical protein
LRCRSLAFFGRKIVDRPTASHKLSLNKTTTTIVGTIPMKTKIQKFKPTMENLMLFDTVLRRSVRLAFRTRNQNQFPTVKKWRRDDIREAIKAYRIICNTELENSL